MSFGFHRSRIAALSLLVAIAACGDCKSSSERDDSAPSPVSHARTVAELDVPIHALVGSRDGLFGVGRHDGVIFSVTLSGDAGGSVRKLSVSEREPFAIVARAGNPVWASREGVFTCEPDGRERRALFESGAIVALTASPHGVVFSDGKAIWRIEWPQAAKPIRLADGVDAEEVVATDETVVWIERSPGSVSALDLKSGARRQLAPAGRKGHDLSLSNDGHSVLWHEGEADLLPGRDPRAFLADTLTGAIRELPGAYESSKDYLLRGACVFGPATCKPVALVDWTRLDTGEGEAPIADDAGSFYWVTPAPVPCGSYPNRWRILSAPKTLCCH
jgi:hypothetical protein